MADTSDKTEKPTPKKLKDTVEEGRTAKSRDVTVAVTSLTATAMIVWMGPAIVQRLAARMSEALIGLSLMGRRDILPEELSTMVLRHGGIIAALVAPIAIAVAVVSVASTAAQGGLHFTLKSLKPNISKLNPANGLKKLVPSQSGIDLLKMILTVCVLGTIGFQIAKSLAITSVRFPWMSPVGAAGAGWQSATRLLWQTGFALLVLGGGDYGIQRWRLMKSIKMSVQEVRDEGRSSEGSPETKQRMRRVQRDMSRRQMLRDTEHATVVITNPTHYAVALEYRREKNPAPIVVAKGRDLVAQRIRDIARKHAVPIIENPTLARALHAGVEVGDTIPSELFGAVAEVLGYLIRIKQLML